MPTGYPIKRASHLVEVWLCTICGESGDVDTHGSSVKKVSGVRRWYCPVCTAEEKAYQADPFEAEEAYDLTELLDMRLPWDESEL